MQSPRKVPAIIRWWVTPKLPVHDVFVDYAKKAKNPLEKVKIIISQWVLHPIKRRLARVYLKFLQKVTDIKVIAITGSAGKTTTKEMIASILSLVGKTVWTPKSVDSVYNIPNTILKTPPSTKYLILEMSVEFPGEMGYYLWLAKPDIAVITNISETHTQYLKSVQGVANEKEKLILALSKNDTAVLNRENDYIKNMAKKTNAKVVWFGKNSDIQAPKIKIDSSLNTIYTLGIRESKINVQLPIPGKQFVENSLAAAATAYILGISPLNIKKGLESFQKSEHRMVVIKLKSGALVLDDTYSNNPRAAIIALNTLKEVANGKKIIVVMGDMLELGEDELRAHKEVGNYIGVIGVDYLIGVGKAAKVLVDTAASKMGKEKTYWVSNWTGVIPKLKPTLLKNTITLIKGSRSVGLDNVVARLS